MSNNKLVKAVLDTTTLTGLAAGIGSVAKKKKQLKKTSLLTPAAM